MATVTPLSGNLNNAKPSAELGTNGLRDVVDALTGPGHDPRFNAMKTMGRSEAFWLAVEPLKQDLLARVHLDLGGEENAPETALGLRDAYCETRLFRQSMFLRLVDSGGPITNKGKTRALYTAYNQALDREAKLAQLLGLERRTRDVSKMSITDYLEHQKGEAS